MTPPTSAGNSSTGYSAQAMTAAAAEARAADSAVATLAAAAAEAISASAKRRRVGTMRQKRQTASAAAKKAAAAAELALDSYCPPALADINPLSSKLLPNLEHAEATAQVAEDEATAASLVRLCRADVAPPSASAP